MEEAAFFPENEDQLASGSGRQTREKQPKLTKLEALRAQLQEAIEREDYEKAAKLRDELRKLEAQQRGS